MKIVDIKERFNVRNLNQNYVDALAEMFKKDGYQISYPVSVTDDGILWDGNHRVAAAEKLGWDEIPHVVENPENIRIASHKRNTAATNALPETFVDHAEEIFGLSAAGKTQQAIADEIGWGISKVKQYSQLKKITSIAWEKIVTDFSKMETFNEDGVVTKKVTTVTERMLRNILDLNEYHQISIVSGIIDGTIKPAQVKKLSATYTDRESFIKYAAEKLLNQDMFNEFEKDCLNGLYSSQEQIVKAVQQANDDWEKKNSIRILIGDCMEQLDNVADDSCNALITDPPYSMLGEDWDTFETKEKFIEFTKGWIGKAIPKLKKTGRIYIFWPPSLHHLFPYDAIQEPFKPGTSPLLWVRKNAIKPHNRKDYVMTYEFIFYFYSEESPPLNLPKSEDWNTSTNNMNIFEHAQPQTNFKEGKEHPAQKPLALMEEIIKVGTEIGDMILDPFGGSGTTGLAAKKLKRKAVLIEKNEEYIKIIQKRLS